MKSKELFGFLLRCGGLVSAMYGLYYSAGNAWRMMAQGNTVSVDTNNWAHFSTHYFWAFLGALPFLVVGIFVIRFAPEILRITYGESVVNGREAETTASEKLPLPPH